MHSWVRTKMEALQRLESVPPPIRLELRKRIKSPETNTVTSTQQISGTFQDPC
jgi:hypothetical protein